MNTVVASRSVAPAGTGCPGGKKKEYIFHVTDKQQWDVTHFNLLTNDHVDDASPAQVQHVPDADHDGRTDAQWTDHVHVAQVGENRVFERPEREHRYDGAQREQEHGYQKIGIRNAVAGTARSAHVLGYMHPIPHVVGFHFKRILGTPATFGRNVNKPDRWKTDPPLARSHFRAKTSRPSFSLSPFAPLTFTFVINFYCFVFFYFFFSIFLICLSVAHGAHQRLSRTVRTNREGNRADQQSAGVAVGLCAKGERLRTGSRSIRIDHNRYRSFYNKVPPRF